MMKHITLKTKHQPFGLTFDDSMNHTVNDSVYDYIKELEKQIRWSRGILQKNPGQMKITRSYARVK